MSNCYPEVKGNKAVARKRPGTTSSSLDYVTPQGFSGLSFTDLPYELFPNISDVLFSISSDVWALTDIASAWGPAVIVTPVTVSTVEGKAFIVGTYYGGRLVTSDQSDQSVWNTIDLGATWDNSGPGMGEDFVRVGNDGSKVYVLASDNTWIESADHGATWQYTLPAPIGLDWGYGSFKYLEGTAVYVVPSHETAVSADYHTWSIVGTVNSPATRLGVVKVGGKYFAANPVSLGIVYSTDLVSWSDFPGSPLDSLPKRFLFTDGIFLYLMQFQTATDGFTIHKMNPDTLSVVAVQEDTTFPTSDSYDVSPFSVFNSGGHVYFILARSGPTRTDIVKLM